MPPVGAESLQCDRVRTVGSGCIGNPSDVVEDHGAGAFEENVVVFEPGVVDDVLDSKLFFQGVDDVDTTLGPTAR